MEEKDPEKVLKAAKRFIGDMMTEVFKDDIHLLEKKHGHKGMNKLYELLMDLEEDNPGRKFS